MLTIEQKLAKTNEQLVALSQYVHGMGHRLDAVEVAVTEVDKRQVQLAKQLNVVIKTLTETVKEIRAITADSPTDDYTDHWWRNNDSPPWESN